MNPIENLYYYLAISASMFMLGIIGVLIRRNAIIVFMCIELMLNAVNLALVAFSSYWNDPAGTMLVFFVMCVAAAEAVVGLAIIIALFRNKETVNLNDVNIFKW